MFRHRELWGTTEALSGGCGFAAGLTLVLDPRRVSQTSYKLKNVSLLAVAGFGKSSNRPAVDQTPHQDLEVSGGLSKGRGCSLFSASHNCFLF